MGRHIRYTCAKKNHPILKKDCEKCHEYNPCAKDGKWCFVGALIADHEANLAVSAMGKNVESAVAPVLRDQTTITIHLDGQTSVEVPKEDIADQIRKSLYSSLKSNFGF